MSAPITPVAPATAATPVAPASTSSTKALFTWKNPQKTGKVFATSLVTLLLLKYVNLLNLFFRFAFIGLLLSGAGEYVGKLVTGSGFASRFKPANNHKVAKTVVEVSPKLEKYIVPLEQKIYSILYASDVESTLKASALCYLLYKITSWFSLYTIVFTSLVLAFTVPITYVTYEKEIHEAKAKYYSLAKSKAIDYKNLAHEKSKPYISQVNTKLSPYTSKVSGYLPKNRTAGSTIASKPVTSAAHTDSAVSSGVNVNSTVASSLPKVPATEPISANSVDINDLKQAIKENKTAVLN